MTIVYEWDVIEATIDPITNNVTHWRFVLSGSDNEYSAVMSIFFNNISEEHETDGEGICTIRHEKIELSLKPLSEYTKSEVKTLAELIAEKNGWYKAIESSIKAQKKEPITTMFDIV
jgi:hypothetical protein